MKNLKYLIPLSALPTFIVSSCVLDGKFNTHNKDWDFASFNNIKNYKNIDSDTVKIKLVKPIDNVKEFENQINNIQTQKQAQQIIEKYFQISLDVIDHEHNHNEKEEHEHNHSIHVNNIFQNHDKVLKFQVQFTQKEQKILKLENKILKFSAKFASDEYDEENSKEPLYYFEQTFEINLESKNG